jgi:tRNA A-37 threonylcarbamoyl transferase component Bud32
MSCPCLFLHSVLVLLLLFLPRSGVAQSGALIGTASNDWPSFKKIEIKHNDETKSLEGVGKKIEFADGLFVNLYTESNNQGPQVQLKSKDKRASINCTFTLYDSSNKPFKKGSIQWTVGGNNYDTSFEPIVEPDNWARMLWTSIAVVLALVLFVGMLFRRKDGLNTTGARNKRNAKLRVKPVAGSWSTAAHLATGGLAEVRLVRKNPLAPRYIMKILKAHYADDAAFVKALHYETDVLCHLEATGVRRVPRLIAASWDRPDAGGEPWYVMTRMPGMTLKNANLSSFSLRVRLRLIAAIATTLAECHAAEVAHRDLSPDNIMVRSGAGCRFVGLVDFGSASLQGRRHPLGRKWVLKQRFAAPEQLQQGLDVAGPAADVYSLGIVACELLLGSHPFAAEGQLPRLEDHLGFDRVQLAQRLTQRGLKAEVAQAICCVMLAADPASRGTMRLLLTVLRGAYPFLR